MDRNRRAQIQYLLGMIDRMPSKEDNPFKWNRWLGFIQGGMWGLKLIDVEKLKYHNKQGLRKALNYAELILEEAYNNG